jgi:hypothetical protein
LSRDSFFAIKVDIYLFLRFLMFNFVQKYIIHAFYYFVKCYLPKNTIFFILSLFISVFLLIRLYLLGFYLWTFAKTNPR